MGSADGLKRGRGEGRKAQTPARVKGKLRAANRRNVITCRLCPPVTGGARPGRPGRLGSGTVRLRRKALPPSGPLSDREPCELFSVCAVLTRVVYHQMGRLSSKMLGKGRPRLGAGLGAGGQPDETARAPPGGGRGVKLTAALSPSPVPPGAGGAPPQTRYSGRHLPCAGPQRDR